MELNKKQILYIIQQEIDWHNKNKDLADGNKDWVKGFIAGLRCLKNVFKNIKNF